MLKTLLLVAFCLIPVNVWACEAPRPEQRSSAEDLVSRSSRIVLAEVTKATPLQADRSRTRYEFRAITVLKGRVPPKFNLIGSPLFQGALNHFGHHSEPDFWKDGRGRETNHPDCEIHPAFAVGASFLVFLDKPFHVKSFELVSRSFDAKPGPDQWLAYVQAELDSKK